MLDQDMLEALEGLVTRIVKTEIKEAQKQTMRDVSALMDLQFMGQFNLLAEKQDMILEKMPSQEDMDIIDGSLQEHEEEIKLLRQDVNELKKAQ